MGNFYRHAPKKEIVKNRPGRSSRAVASCLEVMLWYHKPAERIMLKDEDGPFKDYEKPLPRKKVCHSLFMRVFER